ncbi:hypothetical protein ACQKOA_04920 [Bacillus mobilis]|uniref:hypothetical protein n=1 Tax=Bacillus mobilis TaxID=2026190 RepID=UPI003CFF9981
MAIYGIGAMYGRSVNKKDEFLINDCACIGWEKEDAPALHKMFQKIKVGDFLYIKSFVVNKKELRVKAVGIVIDDTIKNFKLGQGITVKWLWDSGINPKIIDITESIYKNNVFNNTLYEEHNACIQEEILKLGIEERNLNNSIDDILKVSRNKGSV